jgi:hypothetical protein
MANIKKIYAEYQAQAVVDEKGKTVETCLDSKTYKNVMAALRDWEKLQKRGIRWVSVKQGKTSKKVKKV